MLKPQKRTETLEIAGEKITLERVVNIDALIDAMDEHAFREDERLPYWAELWPSAIALSEYVLEHRHDFREKSVLELGSGLGLCGIAAARAGAKVIFSDYEHAALEMVKANFRRNFNRAPAVSLIDWRDPQEQRRFEVIMASDILYEHRWLEPVRLLLNRCISPGGFAVIAEPGRTVAVPFFEAMTAEGWTDQKDEKTVLLDKKESTIAIHRLKRC